MVEIPPRLRPASEKTYRARLELVDVQALGWPPDPAAVVEYVHSCARAGYRRETVRLTLSAMAAAARGDLGPDWPPCSLDLREARAVERRWAEVERPAARGNLPDPEQVAELWQRFRVGSRDEIRRAALVSAGFWLALRASELGSLDPASEYDAAGRRYLVPASKRSAPMYVRVASAADEPLRALAEFGPGSVVNPGQWARRTLGRICTWHPHDLRAGWATWAASQGASERAIAAHLRHKTPDSARRYVARAATDRELAALLP